MDKILSYEEVLWKRMSSEAKDLLFELQSNILNNNGNDNNKYILDYTSCLEEGNNIEKYLIIKGYYVGHRITGKLVISI